MKNVRINNCKLSKNSRLNINLSELAGLMESIKNEGLLEPIGVVKVSKGYTVCYGNRRFLACSKLGMKTIAAVVYEDIDTTTMDMMNLAENVQRRQLTLNEVGRYVLLLEDQGLVLKEIAVRLGVPYSYVAAAKKCFQDVPKEYRDKIVTTVGVQAKPGKMSISTLNRVESVKTK